MAKKKLFEMLGCSGCRTCEMVCSFERCGEFNPSLSAIKVFEKGNGGGFLISLAEAGDGDKLNCIGCLDCIHQCPASGELRVIIESFGQKD